jgi:hypothetical protein
MLVAYAVLGDDEEFAALALTLVPSQQWLPSLLLAQDDKMSLCEHFVILRASFGNEL